MALFLGTIGTGGALAIYVSSSLSSYEMKVKDLDEKLQYLEHFVASTMSSSTTSTSKELTYLTEKVQTLETVLNNHMATVNSNALVTLKSDLTTLTTQTGLLQQYQKDICKKVRIIICCSVTTLERVYPTFKMALLAELVNAL